MRQRGTPLSPQVTISPKSTWSPSLTDLLIFEPVLKNSATQPYDGLLVRRETLANPTDWKSIQREFTHRVISSTARDASGFHREFTGRPKNGTPSVRTMTNCDYPPRSPPHPLPSLALANRKFPPSHRIFPSAGSDQRPRNRGCEFFPIAAEIGSPTAKPIKTRRSVRLPITGNCRPGNPFGVASPVAIATVWTCGKSWKNVVRYGVEQTAGWFAPSPVWMTAVSGGPTRTLTVGNL
jgi:hypothetical protein